ncbi:MAG: PAS domain S-box protein [Chloroflexota bacterium]
MARPHAPMATVLADVPAQAILSLAAAIAIAVEIVAFVSGDPAAGEALIVLVGAASILGIAAVIRRRGNPRLAALITSALLLAIVAVGGALLDGGGPLGLLAPIAFVLVVPYLRGWRLGVIAVLAVIVTIFAMDTLGLGAGITAPAGRLGTAIGTLVAMVLLLVLTWRTIRRSEHEQRLRARLIADLPVGVVRISEDDRYLEVNQAFASLLGYDMPAEIEGRTLAETYVDPSADPWGAAPEDATGLRVGIAALRRKDGGEVWIRFRTRPVADDPGSETTYESAVEDVTLERSEREAQGRLRDLLESLSDAVFSLALDGTFLSWNRGAERLYGRRAEDVVGSNLFDIVRPSHVPRFRSVLALVAGGRTVPEFEVAQSRPDGTAIAVMLSVAPIRDADGQVVAASAIARDITDQQRLLAQQAELESQLLQAQKMEAVGRLAGGIAHDFNNLLTAITGFGGLVASELHGRQLEDQLQVLRAAERAADLTRRLLAFARRSAADPRPIALDAVVDDAFRMVRRLVPERIDVELDLGSGQSVVADPVEIEQVLINLVVNAVDATPDAGFIRVATRNVILDEAFVEQHLGASEGAHVLLTVADSGVGMDETVRARIFEPFFTTKERGEGTGLGLATVYAIVRRSGGTVWVDSAPGVGTSFSIYLPAVEAASESRLAPQLDVPSGTEAILLLEDEEAVRLLAQRILERAGYRVHAAESPADAVGRLGAAAYDVIVTDVIMPGQSGPDFVDAVDSGVPVVFMSGYTGAGTSRMHLDWPTRALVAKPFDPVGLAGAVRKVLDARTRRDDAEVPDPREPRPDAPA